MDALGWRTSLRAGGGEAEPACRPAIVSPGNDGETCMLRNDSVQYRRCNFQSRTRTSPFGSAGTSASKSPNASSPVSQSAESSSPLLPVSLGSELQCQDERSLFTPALPATSRDGAAQACSTLSGSSYASRAAHHGAPSQLSSTLTSPRSTTVNSSSSLCSYQSPSFQGSVLAVFSPDGQAVGAHSTCACAPEFQKFTMTSTRSVAEEMQTLENALSDSERRRAMLDARVRMLEDALEVSMRREADATAVAAGSACSGISVSPFRVDRALRESVAVQTALLTTRDGAVQTRHVRICDGAAQTVHLNGGACDGETQTHTTELRDAASQMSQLGSLEYPRATKDVEIQVWTEATVCITHDANSQTVAEAQQPPPPKAYFVSRCAQTTDSAVARRSASQGSQACLLPVAVVSAGVQACLPQTPVVSTAAQASSPLVAVKPASTQVHLAHASTASVSTQATVPPASVDTIGIQTSLGSVPRKSTAQQVCLPPKPMQSSALQTCLPSVTVHVVGCQACLPPVAVSHAGVQASLVRADVHSTGMQVCLPSVDVRSVGTDAAAPFSATRSTCTQASHVVCATRDASTCSSPKRVHSESTQVSLHLPLTRSIGVQGPSNGLTMRTTSTQMLFAPETRHTDVQIQAASTRAAARNNMRSTGAQTSPVRPSSARFPLESSSSVADSLEVCSPTVSTSQLSGPNTPHAEPSPKPAAALLATSHGASPTHLSRLHANLVSSLQVRATIPCSDIATSGGILI